MAAHELDNKAERMESHTASAISSLAPELLQNNAIRQMNKAEAAATITSNGFPQLELFDNGASMMKAENASHTLSFKSQYATGSELSSDREMRQVGLKPENVKHTVAKEDGGWTDEKSTVKYPNGVEVTVEARTKHMQSGKDVSVDPEVTVKLPKGYTKDKDGDIKDQNNVTVGQVNEDGTVTMKVRDGKPGEANSYVTQSPAGVTEATVFEHHDNSGIMTTLKVHH